MTDNRFPSPGVDARFPEPWTDVRFPGGGVDVRFPENWIDRRFQGDSYTGVDPLAAYAAAGLNPGLVADFENDKYFGTLSDADDVTMSITSNGTVIDSDGLLKWRAHNLLPYSADPDAAWSIQTNVTLSSGVVTADVGTGARRVSRSTGFIHPKQTLNVELSAGTHDIVQVYGGASTNHFANFDLSSGTVGTSGSDTTASIEAGPNGYICTVQFGSTISPNGNCLVGFVSSTSAGWGAAFTATGSETFNIHRQWVYRSDLGGMQNAPDGTSYVPTTTAAVYLKRWDYSTGSRRLLVERTAATNLETHSNDKDEWSITNTNSVTVTADQGVGPDGENSLSSWTITDTTTENHGMFDSVSVTTDAVYTLSAYVRDIDQRYVSLRAYRSSTNWSVAVFDLTTGTVTQESNGAGSGTISGADIEDLGGGLYRIHLASAQAGTTLFWAVDFTDSGTPTLDAGLGTRSYSGTAGVGLYVGHIQVEAGSVPSSLIPTNGGTVTRDAEGAATIAAAKIPDYQSPTYIGADLVTNGTFDADTDWSGTGGSWTISGGVLNASGPAFGGVTQTSVGLTEGSVYEVSYDVTRTAGGVKIELGGTVGATRGADGSYSEVLVAGPDNDIFINNNGGFAGTVDNLVVREIDPLAVCLALDGEMTREAGRTFNTLLWGSGGNAILAGINVDAYRTYQAESSTFDTVTVSGASTGIAQPYNVASRHGSNFIQMAVDGLAGAEDTAPTALADLSTVNIELVQSATAPPMLLKSFRLWTEDIGQTGIEETTS